MVNTLDSAQPIFPVANLRASIAHYVNAFGFKHHWGDDGFASVSRGRCHILLCENDQGHPGTWAWIGVTDADSFAAELRERGAKIRNPPTNYPWGYELQVEDIDGNVLRLGAEPKEGQPYGRFLDMHRRWWPPLGA